MRLNNESHEANESLSKMSWKNSSGITIIPTHFNSFYFEVHVGNEHGNLHIDEIKGLVDYLLTAIEGLEDTFHIIEEIIKRRVEKSE